MTGGFFVALSALAMLWTAVFLFRWVRLERYRHAMKKRDLAILQAQFRTWAAATPKIVRVAAPPRPSHEALINELLIPVLLGLTLGFVVMAALLAVLAGRSVRRRRNRKKELEHQREPARA